ncbi:unnamed protein product [Calypogeia fissa]
MSSLTLTMHLKRTSHGWSLLFGAEGRKRFLKIISQVQLLLAMFTQELVLLGPSSKVGVFLQLMLRAPHSCIVNFIINLKKKFSK